MHYIRGCRTQPCAKMNQQPCAKMNQQTCAKMNQFFHPIPLTGSSPQDGRM